MDTRHKAAAILSGNKLRMLESAGLTVVESNRQAALEHIAQTGRAWHALFVDGSEGLPNDASGEQVASHIYEFKQRQRELEKAIYALEAVSE